MVVAVTIMMMRRREADQSMFNGRITIISASRKITCISDVTEQSKCPRIRAHLAVLREIERQQLGVYQLRRRESGRNDDRGIGCMDFGKDLRFLLFIRVKPATSPPQERRPKD